MITPKLNELLNKIDFTDLQNLAWMINEKALEPYIDRGNCCGLFPSLFSTSARIIRDKLSSLASIPSEEAEKPSVKGAILLVIATYLSNLATKPDVFLGAAIANTINNTLNKEQRSVALSVIEEFKSFPLLEGAKSEVLSNFKTVPDNGKIINIVENFIPYHEKMRIMLENFATESNEKTPLI